MAPVTTSQGGTTATGELGSPRTMMIQSIGSAPTSGGRADYNHYSGVDGNETRMTLPNPLNTT